MAATPSTTAASASVGITTDIGAVVSLATEVLKDVATVQTELNTPAMVAAKVAAEQVKVDTAIDTAIATNDQATIQKIAGS